mmetsp:Transcript_20578/g.48347  ORF Transcript_20578/g.48347 Transcript_20578/m.48347 type:complete len:527 (+) Transcript_20578:589-2169(+)
MHPPGSARAGQNAFSSSSSLSLTLSSSSSATPSASQSAPAKSAASLVNKLGVSVSKLGDKLLKAADSASATDSHGEHARGPGSSEKIPGAFSKNNHNHNHNHKTNPKQQPRSVWDVLTDQDKFISGVMDVQMSYLSKARQPAKEAHLRSVLEEEGYAPKPGVRGNFPMPCAPQIMVNGVFPQKAKVFKSAVYPALIEFNVEYVVDKTAFVGETPRGPSSSSASSSAAAAAAAASKHSRRGNSGTAAAKPPKTPSSVTIPPQIQSYRVLMKTGDDLRQDQLVMMMIKLMDRLLKRASLDLCITPYSIIATSPSSGMIEFVEESVPLSAILANHNNSILRFFRSVAPQPGTKYGVKPEVISSYVRSVAGGCVLTYLMGVGDRHLDNLMITKTGRFFHIDFGFLFGRDPKPLPPAFRLTREMVEGMGGSESAEYRQFCSLACQAFNALRKSAGLVLNLLHLMSDAGIEDLSNNPSADADGVIAKVEERFKLDLTDEQAERFFLTLINDSLSALAPRLMDVFHSIAVARR